MIDHPHVYGVTAPDRVRIDGGEGLNPFTTGPYIGLFRGGSFSASDQYPGHFVGKRKSVGTHYGERYAGNEPILGVWGTSPQRGPGAEPLVGGSGGRSPLEAEHFFQIWDTFNPV